ncbi:MAG: STAS domain-containing protein [Planctomycetota bacterium]|jgi:anti-sigma B factor antagonist
MFKGFFGKDKTDGAAFVAHEERHVQPPLSNTNIAEIEAIGQVCLLTIEEERIDSNAASQIYELVANLAQDSYRLFVLDLQNVTYLDSAGLGVLIRLLKALDEIEGRIALASVNPYVSSLFRITRMDRAFPICKDAVSAMDALNRAA